MRTTINLDPDLLRRLKELAAQTGRTMTSVIEDALRERLARAAEPPSEVRFRVKPFRAGALRPGVDLDDSAALLDVMERHPGPS